MILHIRYTARQGVEPSKVNASLDDLFEVAAQSGLALLFSLRHDFPTEWSTFVNGADDFSAAIRKDYFAYFTQGKTITIVGLELFAANVSKHHAAGNPGTATADLLADSQFTFSAAPDAQVLKRTANAQVFLIVSYTLL